MEKSMQLFFSTKKGEHYNVADKYKYLEDNTERLRLQYLMKAVNKVIKDK